MVVVERLHGVQPLPQHPRLLLACQLLCTAKNNFILQTYGNVKTILRVYAYCIVLFIGAEIQPKHLVFYTLDFSLVFR